MDRSERELGRGKLVRIKGFPKDYKVTLFRVAASSNHTEWIVTNGLSQGSTRDTRKVRGSCAGRSRSFTGKPKAVDGDRELPVPCFSYPERNHIACALLSVRSRPKNLAYYGGQTVYQIKRGLLRDYLVRQPKNPSVKMVLA